MVHNALYFVRSSHKVIVIMLLAALMPSKLKHAAAFVQFFPPISLFHHSPYQFCVVSWSHNILTINQHIENTMNNISYTVLRRLFIFAEEVSILCF